VLKLIPVILAIALSSPLFAQAPHRHRSRKQWAVSIAILVAANILDARSSLGRQELNPLLRNSRGESSAVRTIAFKSAAVGGILTIEALLVRSRPELARTASVVNFVSAGAVTAVAINNLQ
jgi:hypothetical protein